MQWCIYLLNNYELFHNMLQLHVVINMFIYLKDIAIMENHNSSKTRTFQNVFFQKLFFFFFFFWGGGIVQLFLIMKRASQ